MTVPKTGAKYVSDTAGDVTELVWPINHLLMFICLKKGNMPFKE